MKVKAFSSVEDAFFIVSVRSWHCLSKPVFAKRKASFALRVESGVHVERYFAVLFAVVSKSYEIIKLL